MAAPPVVFNLIGVVFTAILYGLYCLIFGLYWRIQLKRTERRKGVLLYALTVNFILCTAYFIVDIIGVQFFITMAVQKSDSLASASLWLSIAADALYTAIDFVSQLILLYRCWIMWRQLSVLILPSILSIAFLATALTTLGSQIKVTAADQPLPAWYWSAVTAFFFISLGANALLTALIVYKIIIVYHDLRGFNTTSDVHASDIHGHRNLYPLISILIESGLITFAAQLVQAIMYKSATTAFPLIGGCVVMLYGISSTIVLVRVEMGVSYDHITSRTANSTYSGHPMQFTAFPSKLNQTTIAESDDPNETLSGR